MKLNAVPVPKKFQKVLNTDTLVFCERIYNPVQIRGRVVSTASINTGDGKLVFGVSVCAPDDEYDADRGNAMALGRARQQAFRYLASKVDPTVTTLPTLLGAVMRSNVFETKHPQLDSDTLHGLTLATVRDVAVHNSECAAQKKLACKAKKFLKSTGIKITGDTGWKMSPGILAVTTITLPMSELGL
jgi:hypothetical protein